MARIKGLQSKRAKKSTKPAKIARDLTRDELANVLSVSPETITGYDARGAPRERRGRQFFYNAPEYQAWMNANRISGKHGRPIDGEGTPLEQAKLRKENALADRYELDVKKQSGQVIDLEESRRWISDHVTIAKNKFIGFGAAVTPLLEGRDAAERQRIIEDRVIEILNELAAT